MIEVYKKEPPREGFPEEEVFIDKERFFCFFVLRKKAEGVCRENSLCKGMQCEGACLIWGIVSIPTVLQLLGAETKCKSRKYSRLGSDIEERCMAYEIDL